MPTYRYLNPDRTLVLRDDHVIAWDPKTNQPLQPQPSAITRSGGVPPNEVYTLEDTAPQLPRPEPPDEMKLWHDAGSPVPVAAPAQVGATPANMVGMEGGPPWPTVGPGDMTDYPLVSDDPALKPGTTRTMFATSEDIAAVNQQLQQLTRLVRQLLDRK